MKIRLYLNEAKYEKPIIVFHGTDAKNIPGILKHGMLASKKDTGPWADEFKKIPHRADGHTMASFDGIYFAEDLKYAVTSAESSDFAIIVAQINRSSFAVDEDNVRSRILIDLNRAIQREHFHGTDENETLNQILENFSIFFSIEDRRELNSYIPILKKLIELYRYRFINWKKIPDQELIQLETQSRKLFEVITFKLGKKKNAEFNHLKTHRYPGNIGFRGRNRIIGILHVNREKNAMKIVYGEVPKFVTDYFQSMFNAYEDLIIKNQKKSPF